MIEFRYDTEHFWEWTTLWRWIKSKETGIVCDPDEAFDAYDRAHGTDTRSGTGSND